MSGGRLSSLETGFDVSALSAFFDFAVVAFESAAQTLMPAVPAHASASTRERSSVEREVCFMTGSKIRVRRALLASDFVPLNRFRMADSATDKSNTRSNKGPVVTRSQSQN